MTLTDDQLKAIHYIKNNSAIMACPGSGKTTILINKMIVCHEKMKKHNGFIALSFTKKSSYDLKFRFNKIGNNSSNNFFGTIYDFFLNEIIRPFLSNIWQGNSKELEVVKILDNLESQHFVNDPSRKKISLKDIEDENGYQGLFNDGKILINTINALALLVIKKSSSCRRYISAKYKYIFIDEYQDTSFDQHLVFLEINNLNLIFTVVGDVNQSIYKWNNASPEYLLSFVKNYKFKEFRIFKNHRCHSSIYKYANKFLGLSEEDVEDEKKIFKIKLNDNNKSRYEKLDEIIEKIINSHKVEKNKIAVISRLNSAIEMYSRNTKHQHKIYLDDPLDKIGCKISLFCSDLIKYKFSKRISLYEIYQRNNIIKNKIGLVDFKNTFKDLREIEDSEKICIKLQDFLESLYLKEDIEPILAAFRTILNDKNFIKFYKPEDNNDIQMLNIHKSKGLEFKVVIHIGLEDKSFPLVMKLESGWGVKDIQEEKNLHYVALTRAEKICLLVSMPKRVKIPFAD